MPRKMRPVRRARSALFEQMCRTWGGEENLRRYVRHHIVIGWANSEIAKEIGVVPGTLTEWVNKWRFDIRPAGFTVYDPIAQREYWPYPGPTGVKEYMPEARDRL